ncbi:MAG: class I SAM-dependent DNA methyltransferase [Gemmatimonadota bacterium]
MKRYDRAYFDRFYRTPRHRVRTAGELRRRVALVIGVTEYVLQRPLRSVLDVGCGEGAWLTELRRIRPGVRYLGIDPSEYAVRRFGTRRNLRLGTLATLDDHAPRRRFDLVICADVLHYLPPEDLALGLRQLADRVGGVAYLPVFTSADDIEGDCAGWRRRPPAFYRRYIGDAGLVPVGLGCHVRASVAVDLLGALERPPHLP